MMSDLIQIEELNKRGRRRPKITLVELVKTRNVN